MADICIQLLERHMKEALTGNLNDETSEHSQEKEDFKEPRTEVAAWSKWDDETKMLQKYGNLEIVLLWGGAGI